MLKEETKQPLYLTKDRGMTAEEKAIELVRQMSLVSFADAFMSYSSWVDKARSIIEELDKIDFNDHGDSQK